MTSMSSVVIIRPQHPLEGRSLRVLGRIRRHGRLELLLVLPDGSKRLIPRAWTDAERDSVSEGTTLGSLTDLLAACALVAALGERGHGEQGQAARKSPSKEDFHAACPAQFDTRPEPDATGGVGRATTRAVDRRGDHAAGRRDRQDRGPAGTGGGQ
ncbi:MAG TPA: DUF5372 family protein [Pseudonocardiaceae bacterium]|jgi:hypothetical protein|nr:DUF5372 family protein [Pseudonocardiaceae bacterium]